MSFRADDVVVLTVSGRGDKDMETYLRQMNRPEIVGNL
jgi:tryptophan synthase beta chain